MGERVESQVHVQFRDTTTKSTADGRSAGMAQVGNVRCMIAVT